MSCSYKSNVECPECGKNDMTTQEYDSGGFWYWYKRRKQRNYGIRYPYIADNPETNYDSWRPNSEIETFIDGDKFDNCVGNHHHEFIPKDYVK